MKIGYATDPARRLAELQTGSSHRLRSLAVGEGGRSREAALHVEFGRWRRHGEWFRLPREQVDRLVRVVRGEEKMRRPRAVRTFYRLEAQAQRKVKRERSERWSGTRSMHGYPKASKVTTSWMAEDEAMFDRAVARDD